MVTFPSALICILQKVILNDLMFWMLAYRVQALIISFQQGIFTLNTILDQLLEFLEFYLHYYLVDAWVLQEWRFLFIEIRLHEWEILDTVTVC